MLKSCLNWFRRRKIVKRKLITLRKSRWNGRINIFRNLRSLTKWIPLLQISKLTRVWSFRSSNKTSYQHPCRTLRCRRVRLQVHCFHWSPLNIVNPNSRRKTKIVPYQRKTSSWDSFNLMRRCVRWIKSKLIKNQFSPSRQSLLPSLILVFNQPLQQISFRNQSLQRQPLFSKTLLLRRPAPPQIHFLRQTFRLQATSLIQLKP